MPHSPLISEDRRVSDEALKQSLGMPEVIQMLKAGTPGYDELPQAIQEDLKAAAWAGVSGLQSPFQMGQMTTWLSHAKTRAIAKHQIDNIIAGQKSLMRRSLGLIPPSFLLGYVAARLIPQLLTWIRSTP